MLSLNVTRERAFFEIRYLIAAPIVLFMLLQFALLYLYWRKVLGSKETLLLRIIHFPIILVFSIENMIFNTFVGTFMFWDLPRELAFSERLRRYAYDTDEDVYGWHRMARAVNYWDPDHI